MFPKPNGTGYPRCRWALSSSCVPYKRDRPAPRNYSCRTGRFVMVLFHHYFSLLCVSSGHSSSTFLWLSVIGSTETYFGVGFPSSAHAAEYTIRCPISIGLEETMPILPLVTCSIRCATELLIWLVTTTTSSRRFACSHPLIRAAATCILDKQALHLRIAAVQLLKIIHRIMIIDF